MKIIISMFLAIVSSSMFVQAQVNGNIGGTIGGTPVSIGLSNSQVVGGSIGGTIKGSPFSISFSNSSGLGVNNGPVLGLINLAQLAVSRLGVFMIGLGLLAFFWYLIQYIWKGDESPEKHQEGLKGMGYSILALFVMVSIWGIIGLMANILGTGVGGGIPSLEMPKMK